MSYPDLSTALQMVAVTDPGRVRSNNEDSVLANSQLGLAVLADGMGGYNAGEVASGMATSLLGQELEKAFSGRAPADAATDGRSWASVALVDVIERTNAAIFETANSQTTCAGMGTTLVAAQFFDDRLAVAHVGDSRLYRLRDGAMSQITRDHSFLQEQIDGGLITREQARYSRNKNLVTRALGVEAKVQVEINEFSVLPGDLYLLCSDGLNDMVEDEEIELALASLSGNLPLCATQLVQMANDNGGRDNVSVILVKVDKAFTASASAGNWLARVKSWLKK